jgi:hypothetical protein
MRRVALLVVPVVLIPIAAASCSLFTSLDGLQGSAGASPDASTDDAAADASPVDSSTTSDAAPEASTGLLSCNADGLVAYWPLDEGSGVTVHDCHQNLQGAFGTSAPTWGSRNSGSDLEFSSAPAYVTFGVVATLQLPGPFTVAGWFRVDTIPTNYISLFWNYDGGSLTGFEITMAPDGSAYAQAGFGSGNINAQFPTLPTHTWVHLAAVFTPNVELRIYLNGATTGASSTLNDGGSIAGLTVAPDDHDARFGADDPDSTWTGGIDDVRMFSRALSATEIATLAAQ